MAKPLFNYKSPALDVRCSSAHIAKFSEHIEDWEELAPYFGLTEAEQQEIRASHALQYKVQKRKMLWKWVRKLGEKATYRELIKVLEEAGESLLVDKVNELLQDSYSEAPHIIVNSFRQYLKDCYSTSASDGVADREDWPRLKHPMIFVNPDLVSKDEKTSLTTLDIFKDKKVLLEGTAGSGKTTLMRHACQQWAEGKLLNDVDLLIHLTLADPTLRSAKCLEDIIPHPTSIEMRRAVAEYITERGGKGCCFILDGWEDLPEELHRSSVFHDLLKGSKPGLALPHCSFIATTRPIVSPSLQPLVTTTVCKSAWLASLHNRISWTHQCWSLV